MSKSSIDPATSQKLLENISNMEKIISLDAPLGKAKSAVETTIKGLEAVSHLLKAVPVWGPTAEAICNGINKLLKLALGATANQEMCLYLSNRIFFLHSSNLKILVKQQEKSDDATTIQKLLDEINKVVHESQKLIEPYAPRLDEQENSKAGTVKKVAQFLSKVYTNIFDSMDREKFEDLNKKIDRISQDATLYFVVSGGGAGSNNNSKLPSVSAEQLKSYWKQSEQEITKKIKAEMAKGNEEVMSVLGSVASRIDTLSSQVQDVQTMMANAFSVLLKNKDFESCKWQGELSRLVIDKSSVLGRGGSGIVYAAQLGGSEKLAAKRLFVAEGEDPQIAARSILRECQKLQQANHPNVVRTYGVTVQKPDTYLIQERCACTLEELVQKLGHEIFPEPVRLYYCWSLAKAYAHLHTLGFVMGDIKQANVLINSSGKCCVSDFGSVKNTSTMTSTANSSGQQLEVTPAYAAPEIPAQGVTTFQSDVYSFGCLVFETVTGKQFYKQHTHLTLDETVKNEKVRRLIRRCLASSPLDRPTMSAIDSEFDNIILSSSGLSTDEYSDEQVLFSVIQSFKRKAASSLSLDPNALPSSSSPTSPHHHHHNTQPFSPTTQTFPYWMKALPISDENKKLLLENEFDTIETLSRLTEQDCEEIKLPIGARKKLVESIPEICAGATVFEKINPNFEKEFIALQREEQQQWKNEIIAQSELLLAIQLFVKTQEKTYDAIVKEFEKDCEALSAHMSRVATIGPILSEKTALLIKAKEESSRSESELRTAKREFSAETEKALTSRMQSDEAKSKIAQLKTECIQKRLPDLVSSPSFKQEISSASSFSDARTKVQALIAKQSKEILPGFSTAMSQAEVAVSGAKQKGEDNKFEKFVMAESDPRWQKDADASKCNGCNGEFTLFNRRHHCRASCGKVFCGNCTSKILAASDCPSGTHSSSAEQIRSCNSCFDRVTAAKKVAQELPGLEQAALFAKKKVDEVKDGIASLETALAKIFEFEKETQANEQEIAQKEMAGQNQQIFQNYFVAEDAFNNAASRVLCLETQVAACNVLLDPLQAFPEKFSLHCRYHTLILSKPARIHFVSLVDSDALMAVTGCSDAVRSSTAETVDCEVVYDWPWRKQNNFMSAHFQKRIDAIGYQNKDSEKTVIAGVTPILLQAVIGAESFFKKQLDSEETKCIVRRAQTPDHRTCLTFASMYGHNNLLRSFLVDFDIVATSKADSGMSPLHWASVGGFLSCVKILVEQGADVNTVTEKSGYAAVHFACFANNAAVTHYLLVSAGCANLRTKQKNISILHCACTSSSIECAKIILAFGNVADVNEAQDDGVTPLMFVTQRGFLNMTKLFVSMGVDLNVKSLRGYDAFHLACFYGNTEIVRWFLDMKFVKKQIDFDMNSTAGVSSDCVTPFLCAAKEGHLEIVKMLLEHDVNKNDEDEEKRLVNSRDSKGRNAIGRCAISKQPEMIKYFIGTCGVDPETKYTDGTDFRPIHSACNSAHLETLKALLETPRPGAKAKKTVNVEARTKARNSPMLLAANLDDLDASYNMVRYLVEKWKVESDAVNQHNYGALHMAAEKGNLDLVKYLVEDLKLNLEAMSNAGTTILSAAAANGRADVVRYLLSNHTVNKETANVNGATSLVVAARERHVECVRTLVEFGCNVEQVTTAGFTPFLYACLSGDFESVRVLCASNCNQKATTKLGNSGLHCAALVEKKELYEEAGRIIDFLLNDETGAANTEFWRKSINQAGESERTPLSLACERGNLFAIRPLLAFVEPVNIKPATSASKSKNAAQQQQQQQQYVKIDLNAPSNKLKTTPLMYLAACKEDPNVTEAVRLLLAHAGTKKSEMLEAQTASTGSTTSTSLLIACEKNTSVAKLLISSGANKKAVTNNGLNAVHHAAIHNNVTLVKYLCENVTGFDLEAKSSVTSSTPFLAAAQNYSFDVIQYYLDAAQDEYIKVDLDAVDKEGRNALHHMCWPNKSTKEKQFDCVKLLLTHPATKKCAWRNCDVPDKTDGKQLPIHLAAEKGKQDIFDFICDRTPAHLRDASNGRGLTPAFAAVCAENWPLGILKRLHEEFGASLNTVSATSGNSILMIVCADKTSLLNYAKVEYLIKHGVGTGYVNPKTGSNALLEACLAGKHPKIVELLLKQRGLSITDKDNNGMSVLHRCVHGDNAEMADFLLKQTGIERDVATATERSTALHIACHFGHPKVCKVLVDNGCSKLQQDKNGNTPYAVAIAKKNDECAIIVKP